MTDRRQQRTRDAIRNAFIKLATSRRYEDFSAADLIETAGIGKSTFYEHYRSKDDLLQALMDGMLAELAGAAGGIVSAEQLRGLLMHFWDNRRLGKAAFGPQLSPAIRRRLAELIRAAIEEREGAGGNRSRVRGTFAAAGQVGLLHAWLSGELSADVDEIALQIAAEASALRAR